MVSAINFGKLPCSAGFETRPRRARISTKKCASLVYELPAIFARKKSTLVMFLFLLLPRTSSSTHRGGAPDRELSVVLPAGGRRLRALRGWNCCSVPATLETSTSAERKKVIPGEYVAFLSTRGGDDLSQLRYDLGQHLTSEWKLRPGILRHLVSPLQVTAESKEGNTHKYFAPGSPLLRLVATLPCEADSVKDLIDVATGLNGDQQALNEAARYCSPPLLIDTVGIEKAVGIELGVGLIDGTTSSVPPGHISTDEEENHLLRPCEGGATAESTSGFSTRIRGRVIAVERDAIFLELQEFPARCNFFGTTSAPQTPRRVCLLRTLGHCAVSLVPPDEGHVVAAVVDGGQHLPSAESRGDDELHARFPRGTCLSHPRQTMVLVADKKRIFRGVTEETMPTLEFKVPLNVVDGSGDDHSTAETKQQEEFQAFVAHLFARQSHSINSAADEEVPPPPPKFEILLSPSEGSSTTEEISDETNEGGDSSSQRKKCLLSLHFQFSRACPGAWAGVGFLDLGSRCALAIAAKNLRCPLSEKEDWVSEFIVPLRGGTMNR